MLDALRRLTSSSRRKHAGGGVSASRAKGLQVQIHSESFYTGQDGLVTIWDTSKRRMVTRAASDAHTNASPHVYFVWDEEPIARGLEHGWGHPPFELGARVTVAIAGDDEDDDTAADGELKIVRKLGWGDSASVWLVERRPTDGERAPAPRFYAYKVLTAAASALLAQRRMQETQVLLAIRAHGCAPGAEFCDRAHVMLSTRSPQGSHDGFLFDVHGTDLGKLVERQPGQKLASKAARRVLTQLLQALCFLHATCRVVHTDIKENNIAVRIPQNAEMITEYIRREPSTKYPSRVAPKIISLDPIDTVCSQPVPNFGLDDDLGNISVVLGDFGSAVFVDGALEGVVQPARYRAPEVNLGHVWSTPVDIWSVGCLAFEWLTAVDAFPLTFKGLESIEDEERYLQLVYALQTKATGAFTSAFLARCTRAHPYFHENGVPKFQPAVTKTSVLERIRLSGYCGTDASHAARFIERCLTMDCTRRPSAADLLQEEWLKPA